VHSAAEKRGFITNHRQEFGSVERGCEVMGLSRSTYYYQPRPKSMEGKKEEADLRDRIEQIVVECARYGYRRVTYQLRRGGWKVNHKRWARMTREHTQRRQMK